MPPIGITPTLNSSATATAVGTIGATTFGAVNIGASGASADAQNTAALLTGGSAGSTASGTTTGTNWTLYISLLGLAITVWFVFLKKRR